ncbi:MAG: D-alanine--D-alanine ligase [bacterium]|nr:D-alanine--D-alanine ligase [bacterium]
MKVNVICGGQSKEREISLRSGNAVASALSASGHTVKILDSSATIEELADCDVVFPVLHGVGGEDGTLQRRLEDHGIKFVGSGSEASSLCMDKVAYRHKMIGLGFDLAEGYAYNFEQYNGSNLSKQPHVVKPIDGGSSIDTIIIRQTKQQISSEVKELFKIYDKLLVESLIVGDEITVGVLGESALPVIEIIPPQNGEFDYENKYNGKTQELCPPENVSQQDQLASQSLAERVHEATDCSDFSRTDFILQSDGKLILLETNTIPGMTEQSLFPKMAAKTGLTMPELTDKLVRMSVER